MRACPVNPGAAVPIIGIRSMLGEEEAALHQMDGRTGAKGHEPTVAGESGGAKLDHGSGGIVPLRAA